MATTEQRSIRRRNREQIIDRLSDLPDSVLCHILSFLPTKISVRSSILARRWRYLWAEVPTLDFDSENEALIDGVLSLHKLQSINTFRLSVMYVHYDNWYHPKTWVTAAINRNVQNLDLIGFYDTMLPQCLFTCNTLVDLRLAHCDVTTVSSLCLPHLKKLQLIWVQSYESDDTLSNLLSNCPVLEEFVIQIYIDYNYCKISSPTIKRLMITLESDCPMIEEPDEYEDYYDRLEINTPSLVYLQLVDYSGQHIKSVALTSLIEADIGVYTNIMPPDDLVYSQSLVEFVDRMRDVKFLKLYLSHSTEILDLLISARNISFRNLTKLDLTIDCPFLSKFLENADNLEILILREVHEEIRGWTEPQQVPACLLSNLRTVKVVHFVDSENMFKIVRYLLRNAQVLETMDVVYPGSLNLEHDSNIFQQISLFQRGSKACEVIWIAELT